MDNKNIQSRFKALADLINKQDNKNPLLKDCIDHLKGELKFTFFREIEKPNKEEITNIYEKRRDLERERSNNPFVIGYDELLSALKNSSVESINLSNLSTPTETFVIFSDFDYQQFIGIIKSNRTLSELQDKLQLGKRYEYKDHRFVNGKIMVANE